MITVGAVIACIILTKERDKIDKTVDYMIF